MKNETEIEHIALHYNLIETSTSSSVLFAFMHSLIVHKHLYKW